MCICVPTHYGRHRTDLKKLVQFLSSLNATQANGGFYLVPAPEGASAASGQENEQPERQGERHQSRHIPGALGASPGTVLSGPSCCPQ